MYVNYIAANDLVGLFAQIVYYCSTLSFSLPDSVIMVKSCGYGCVRAHFYDNRPYQDAVEHYFQEVCQ